MNLLFKSLGCMRIFFFQSCCDLVLKYSKNLTEKGFFCKNSLSRKVLLKGQERDITRITMVDRWLSMETTSHQFLVRALCQGHAMPRLARQLEVNLKMTSNQTCKLYSLNFFLMVVYNFGINIISYNFKGVYRNKSGGGEKNLRKAKISFCPPPQELLGGSKIWTVNSKHLVSWI